MSLFSPVCYYNFMLEKAKQYLEENLKSASPLLLGLSGGPDSMALFTLLLEQKIPFVVCHVDHGWREESFQEGEILRSLCAQNTIPFFLHRITDFDFDRGNIEDRLRQERIRFFQLIYKEVHASALLLGHQKDDQAETVLKRILEGSSLAHLGGIELVAQMGQMKILRPLLFHTKGEIYQYLQARNITYFEDRTNEDTAYLRARMRKEIIPNLEKEFGKGIKDNLIHVSDQLKKMQGYFTERVTPFLEPIAQGPLGPFIEVPALIGIEMEYWLRLLCQKMEITLSRREVEVLLLIIEGKKHGKKIIRGKTEIIFDRGILMFCKIHNTCVC